MIRNIGKAAFLATAVIAAGTAFVNCSKKHTDDDVGSLTLALTLSPGVVVNTVTYQITGNGIAAINGSIDVSMATQATALVSGLPAGNGYLVTMHADSTDNMTHCDGQANFNVAASQTVAVTVVLQCRGPGRTVGQVAVTGRLDNCPFITSVSASALQAVVGGSVNIGVAATDLDTTDTITYSWTANPTGIGTIGSTTSANTTFTCTAAGSTQLSIAITDTVCGDSLTNIIPITCNRPAATGTAGTTGAAGAGGRGGTTGTAGTGVAGTTGGGGAGTTGTAGGGGAGSTGTGGTGGVVMACSNGEPFSGNMTTCCQCTVDNCSLGPTGTDGCAGLADPTDRSLCVALYNCIAAAAPACSSAGDPTNCFCGTNQATCFTTAGAANGVCASQFVAAAKTTDPVAIQARFVSPNFPIGRAVNLTACRGSFCGGECAIQ